MATGLVGAWLAIWLLAVPGVGMADGVAITEGVLAVEVETASGPVTITRVQDPASTIDPDFAKTSRACPPFCIQPEVVAPGVATVGELELIDFLKQKKGVLVDARTQDWHLRGTLPGAVNIPYTEIVGRLGELGCTRKDSGWNCAQSRLTLLFCNGPWCEQSPSAIRAMLKEGFPAERIFYYRGGVQAWKSFGLTMVEGSF